MADIDKQLEQEMMEKYGQTKVSYGTAGFRT